MGPSTLPCKHVVEVNSMVETRETGTEIEEDAEAIEVAVRTADVVASGTPVEVSAHLVVDPTKVTIAPREVKIKKIISDKINR